MPARDEKAERNLECNHCGRLFRFKWQLSEHTRRHENKTPHKCNLCSKAFVKNSDLTTHLRSHSDEKLFKCKYCARPFKSRQGKLFHEDIHGFNSYECPKCKEIFPSYWKLSKHKRTHKRVAVKSCDVSSFECSFCLVTFSTLEFKVKHEESVHKKRSESNSISAKKTKKSVCSEMRPSKITVMNKILKSQNIQIPPFSCSACSQTFPGRTSLSKHIKVEHPGEKLFYQQCLLCQKNISFNYFRSHIMSHYNIRPFSCKICDAKFVRNHDLQHHITIHSNQKPFECSECHKKCQSVKSLSQHKKYHHSRVFHICNLCGKSFKKEPSLKGHVMRIHCKDKKKVMCHICSTEVFSFDLKSHTKRHHDNEKRLCEICGLTFKNVWTYRYHIISCKNEKNDDIASIDLLPVKALTVVPCPHCSYLSKNTYVFKRHCLKFHSEKVFNCIICSKFFLNKNKYKTHLKKHNMDINLYVHNLSVYECSFCGFIPLGFISLIEHLQSHEYFKWLLSWNRPNLNVGLDKSAVKSNDNDDFLFSSFNSASFEIQNDSYNGINLLIKIKEEISWIHNCTSKDTFRIESQSFKYNSHNSCSKNINKNSIQQDDSTIRLLASSNYDNLIEAPSCDDQINNTNAKLQLPLKTENQFSILHDGFTNKEKKIYSERPFVYVDDLKKLNIVALKEFLQNL